jgi:hypothetical protein
MCFSTLGNDGIVGVGNDAASYGRVTGCVVEVVLVLLSMFNGREDVGAGGMGREGVRE